MAFHFDARADSSDEDTPALDLSSWKNRAAGSTNNAPRPAPAPAPAPAPVAPMVVNHDAEDSDSDNSTPDLAAFQASDRKRKRPSATPSPVVPSFQAINSASKRPDGQSTFDLGSDDGTPDPALQLPASEDEDQEEEEVARPAEQKRLMVVVSRKEGKRRKNYRDLRAGDDNVRRVLKESQEQDGTVMYKVLFDDFHVENVPFEELLGLDNGQEALDVFGEGPPSDDDTPPPQPRTKRTKRARMSSTRPGSKRTRPSNGMVSTVDYVDGSDIEASETETTTRARGRKRKQDITRYLDQGPEDDDDDDESDDELSRPTRPTRRNAKVQPTGRTLRTRRTSTGLTESEDDDSDPMAVLQSDVRPKRRKVKTSKFDSLKSERASERQSARTTRHIGDMEEVGEENIWRSESEERVAAKPKVTVTREIFKPLPRNDEFRIRHNQYCDTCGQGANYAPLVDCQGCSLTYHKSCLGHRTGREHLVTKVDEGEFVLQCRRCVAKAHEKEPTAPDQGRCQECKQHGLGCRPFRPRKTPGQEQRERDENDGVDPIYEVDRSLINNADNVLFRCLSCFRGFHFEHLPSRSDMMDLDMDADAEQRFREYSRDWKCKDCLDAPAKVSGIIAWKPLEEDLYDPATGFEGVPEDEKVYLVRWEGMSYFRARWVPGPWVWGSTTHMMRKAFAKRDDSQHPKMRTEDAIPEDYLRTDIVLDIKFTSIVDIQTEEVDKARIREVEKALIKYKGLNYEDAVWEAPPGPDDGERWSDFVQAYNDWVAGRYVRLPKQSALKTRLEKARKEDFQNLEKQAQPDNVESGKLMDYQIQGLNWLYYKWFTQKNAVLADEMGLGKTIQIIAFLATLVQDHNCFPFLVVVPNSTCPNWRREIKRWAPSLRVVAYYGSAQSREMSYKYELYPENAKDLRCHVVVTSYDAAADENNRKFFRHVAWQGMIVDEGQRLKNDKNLLYAALRAMKVPFKILLTGTPLQNNTRELFNLLHFLDDSYDPASLEKEYEELDQNKITELHDLIRPFFLRRTKAQVLTFLPPMSQIIVPVSMTLVQKKLYKSILAKNPDLMKAIFSTESNAKATERGSLSNILMQLRKCLCHPFVYNQSIEDRQVDQASSHRNLVDASSKLQLLELLLPKLQARGHRVLIFSQFLEMLDMVEDFMDGNQFRYQRLDGKINALTKQKRIDEFNAPDSPLFAFLLSTRAGGVGINLATADTVIILDPDFNPHQDIQALSRAHRIGQNKKVLCFQLVTRASAEERIMQIGRKKLALDHVLIQEMDADDADQNDLVSVLRHGAGELFNDDGSHDIVYDSTSVEHLLDRSRIETTTSGTDKSAESSFAFARVWANDQGALEEAAMPELEESAPDPGVWANILKERERVAAEEAAAKAEAFGRGRRARTNNVDYTGEVPDGAEDIGLTPIKKKKKNRDDGDGSDTDFQADDSDGDDEVDGEQLDGEEVRGLQPDGTKPVTGLAKGKGKPSSPKTKNTSLPIPAKAQTTPKKPVAKAPVAKKAESTPKSAETTPKTPAASRKSAVVKGASSKAQPSPTKQKGTGVKKSEAARKKAAQKASSAHSSPEKMKALAEEARVIAERTTNAQSPTSPMKDSVLGQSPSEPILIDLDESVIPTFQRAHVPKPQIIDFKNVAPANAMDTTNGTPQPPATNDKAAGVNCRACASFHPVGRCPLKLAGVEHCNLCGIAHYGHARVCPHIQSETQVRAMLEALKHSNEPEHLVNEARRYLRGLKGNLVQLKKQKELKEQAARDSYAQAFQKPSYDAPIAPMTTSYQSPWPSY
ncbi:Chromatin remodeling factor mit1 [Fulvia fulva]|uniref:Chromatin remodeling factor mit1 n=1 Tax=Passalora fulva TaxID=5499 RepID=A0A9Q8LGQ4_PASFU|nr:Chromatin remodeling factor mit1 [Fulvia fulva]UJO17082.1 Chromatin remodeling factor mit1 [Fulvia fulva]WPV28145.1 hypothetical protein CLAFUW7_04713 [Fulvia fulva]